MVFWKMMVVFPTSHYSWGLKESVYLRCLYINPNPENNHPQTQTDAQGVRCRFPALLFSVKPHGESESRQNKNGFTYQSWEKSVNSMNFDNGQVYEKQNSYKLVYGCHV